MRRKSIFPAICVVAALISLPARSGDLLQKAAGQAAFCSQKQIVRLDDGVSDARTIARAVAMECQTEVVQMAQAQAIEEGKTVAFANSVAQSMMDGDMFISDVLEHRAQKAKGTGPSD